MAHFHNNMWSRQANGKAELWTDNWANLKDLQAEYRREYSLDFDPEITTLEVVIASDYTRTDILSLTKIPGAQYKTSADYNLKNYVIIPWYRSMNYSDQLFGIGESCFEGGTTLQNVIIDFVPLSSGSTYNIGAIGDYCFKGCNNLAYIGGRRYKQEGENEDKYKPSLIGKITNVGKQAFYNCKNFSPYSNNNDERSLSIAKNTEIGEQAFYKCSKLTSAGLGISGTSGYFNKAKIGKGAFEECECLFENYHLTANEFTNSGFEDRTFAKTKIVSFTLNKKDFNLASAVFEGCSQLKTVQLDSGASWKGDVINDKIFNKCTSLDQFLSSETEVCYIPDNITRIGVEAFSGTKFTKLSLPKTIQNIDKGAFQNCTSLRTIEFREKPQSLIIGDNAFLNCEALSTIKCEEDNTFGEGIIKEIGKSAFQNTKLSYIVIYQNNNKITIKEEAFANCKQLKSFSMFGLYKPVGDNDIGMGVFNGCTSLINYVGPYDFLTKNANSKEEEPLPLKHICFTITSRKSQIKWAEEALNNDEIIQIVPSDLKYLGFMIDSNKTNKIILRPYLSSHQFTKIQEIYVIKDQAEIRVEYSIQNEIIQEKPDTRPIAFKALTTWASGATQEYLYISDEIDLTTRSGAKQKALEKNLIKKYMFLPKDQKPKDIFKNIDYAGNCEHLFLTNTELSSEHINIFTNLKALYLIKEFQVLHSKALFENATLEKIYYYPDKKDATRTKHQFEELSRCGEDIINWDNVLTSQGNKKSSDYTFFNVKKKTHQTNYTLGAKIDTDLILLRSVAQIQKDNESELNYQDIKLFAKGALEINYSVNNNHIIKELILPFIGAKLNLNSDIEEYSSILYIFKEKVPKINVLKLSRTDNKEVHLYGTNSFPALQGLFLKELNIDVNLSDPTQSIRKYNYIFGLNTFDELDMNKKEPKLVFGNKVIKIPNYFAYLPTQSDTIKVATIDCSSMTVTPSTINFGSGCFYNIANKELVFYLPEYINVDSDVSTGEIPSSWFNYNNVYFSKIYCKEEFINLINNHSSFGTQQNILFNHVDYVYQYDTDSNKYLKMEPKLKIEINNNQLSDKFIQNNKIFNALEFNKTDGTISIDSNAFGVENALIEISSNNKEDIKSSGNFLGLLSNFYHTVSTEHLEQLENNSEKGE